MKLTKWMISAGLFSLFGIAGAASAADVMVPGANPVEYKTPSGWTFTIAPYGWLAGLEGDVGARRSDYARRRELRRHTG